MKITSLGHSDSQHNFPTPKPVNLGERALLGWWKSDFGPYTGSFVQPVAPSIVQRIGTVESWEPFQATIQEVVDGEVVSRPFPSHERLAICRRLDSEYLVELRELVAVLDLEGIY